MESGRCEMPFARSWSRASCSPISRGDLRLRVIDGGCGQGTQAIGLARLGHEVVGIDSSEEMLAEARGLASAQPEAVRARLRFEPGDVLALDDTTQERYDVVCCHGVAMYLPSLTARVGRLVCAARPGGLISLLTRRAGIAMRPA